MSVSLARTDNGNPAGRAAATYAGRVTAHLYRTNCKLLLRLKKKRKVNYFNFVDAMHCRHLLHSTLPQPKILESVARLSPRLLEMASVFWLFWIVINIIVVVR